MNAILAVMSDQDMLKVMVRVIIVCAVACGFWALIDFIVKQPLLNYWAKVVLVALAMLFLLNTLIRLG